MRILHVHNFYQLPGGEDQCFASTGAMLKDHGHEVVPFTVHNDAVATLGKVATVTTAIWNGTTYRQLRRLIRTTRPDVAHFENTFPLVSPAAYYACHAEGVPVLQMLHNFRIVCPSAILYRDGRVCEDCLGKGFAWPSIRHGCYRHSRLGSAAVATMTTVHRAIGTWRREVDAACAPNSFVRAKFIEAGFPPATLHVHPYFLSSTPDPGDGAGGYALFAGRLTPEKGIRTLLSAWEKLGPDVPLKVLGDGPEANSVAEAASRCPWIEWLGWRPVEEVQSLTGSAKFAVIPSVWYETFNRMHLDAFSKGTPVVGSDLGSMQAIIDHRRTGLLFRPDDPDNLIQQVRWLLNSPAEVYAQMRAAARQEFEARYAAKASHDRLMGIYAAAYEQMERRIKRRSRVATSPTSASARPVDS
jgi:glycosyltransferase involved in cell wall biosynthesis